jgi:cobalt-zinc-cadmium efflux system outer membrane protein
MIRVWRVVLMPSRETMTFRFNRRVAPAVLWLCGAVGCATTGKAPDRNEIAESIRSRTGASIRIEAGPPSIPTGISLDDGLTADEAVAVALWNSPSFEASLSDLGVARADVVEAGLLKNPVLSLLFPWGPKQLEWTLQFPAEVFWQRPRRVAMATASAQAVGQRLVLDGLRLVADVRLAFADATGGDARLALATENAALAKRIAAIAEARLRAGDISELEARTARSDAAQVQASVLALSHERDLARVTLLELMGLDPPAQPFVLTRALAVPACPAVNALMEEALAARPDVRAAEIGIEAAGERARWERSRVLTLMATLDANAEGSEGYEMGPGFVAELPAFSRNQGGVSRAAAELERASRSYLAVRATVAADVRRASIRLQQAQQAFGIWSGEIVPELEIEQRQAESAYQAGEVALLSLLDASRRLVQARIQAADAGIELERATISVERSVGRGCKP